MASSIRFLGTVASVLLAAGTVVGSVACSSSGDATDDEDSALEQRDAPPVVDLSDAERSSIVQKKATCPFVGTVVAMKKLLVLGSAVNPLALVTGTGSVADLGDTGGGNLGSAVLTIFARGNHHFMRGSSGKLDQTVPENTFSLDFPGSQGSHPGHSGILQGAPTRLDSGAFSAQNFKRLADPKRDNDDQCLPTGHAETAPNGSLVVRRSEIGKFIAENLRADENSKVAGLSVFVKLGMDVHNLGGSIARLVTDQDTDKVFIALTKLTGEDNLVGSSGEFGLLMAFLENSPKTVEIDGEPAVSVDDLSLMFGAKGERRLPDGWETWKKTRHSWVLNTLSLTNSAALEHARLGLHCK
jgi:hypothetical protein